VFKDITNPRPWIGAGKGHRPFVHELKTPLAIVSATVKSSVRVKIIRVSTDRAKPQAPERDSAGGGGYYQEKQRGRRGGYCSKTARPECLRVGSLTNAVVKEARERAAHRNVMLVADAEGDLASG